MHRATHIYVMTWDTNNFNMKIKIKNTKWKNKEAKQNMTRNTRNQLKTNITNEFKQKLRSHA